MQTDRIRIDGHRGTFSIIKQKEQYDRIIYLLESEIYGDEANMLVINQDGELIFENEYNGFDDYEYQLDFMISTDLSPGFIGTFTKEQYDEKHREYWGVKSLCKDD